MQFNLVCPILESYLPMPMKVSTVHRHRSGIVCMSVCIELTVAHILYTGVLRCSLARVSEHDVMGADVALLATITVTPDQLEGTCCRALGRVD